MFKFKRFSCYKTYCRLKRSLANAKEATDKNVNNEEYPKKLLHKKHKIPDNMYIASEETAHLIHQNLAPFLNKTMCNTVIEMNPGMGIFTRRLLSSSKPNKIIAMEPLEQFMPKLKDLQTQHADRLLCKQGDVVGLWKLVYQDKLDCGTRVQTLLEDLPRSAFEDDPKIMLFGAVGSYNFYIQLINAIIFQNGLTNYGRCEMYLIVPPSIYIHLTCAKDIGFMIYRATSILFQILFEHRFIAKLPRDGFLPKQVEYVLPRNSKLKRIKTIDPEYLYLVKIVPRKQAYQLCPTEELHAMWYFIKQNCVSRRNRIIPNLEKFVPGCGPRLIINPQGGEPISKLYAYENPYNLPKYSKPSTTMHTKDYFKNMTIFTQFGDLSSSQMLTLFTQFRSWPEYKNSSFLASLESSVLKLETASDDNVDGLSMEEEDLTEEEQTTTDSFAKKL